MNQSIKAFIQFFLVALVALPLFYACNSGHDKAKGFPKNGTLCLQSANTKTEFIQMEFKNGEVEGKILLEEDVIGKMYYAFKGHVLSDTVLQVTIVYSTDDVSREWVLHETGEGMALSNILDRKDLSHYSIVDCGTLPSLFDYASQEEIAKEEAAEASENPEELCFECTYPGGSKRIIFREYIQLMNRSGHVSGKGAGYSEGDPEWSFVFDGNMVNDTTLELKANYKQEGIDPFSSSETWFINFEKGSIRLKETIPANIRSISNGEYHNISYDGVPENLRNIMDRLSVAN